MDPLSLLRDYVISDQVDQVVVNGDFIEFPGRATFPRTEPTAYKSRRGDTFYDLHSLVFFVQFVNKNKDQGKKFGEYYKLAKENGLMQVAFVDRSDLQDYLSGVLATSQQVHLELPQLDLAPVEAPAKRANLDSTAAPGAAPIDAAAVQESAEEAAIRAIFANERQLRDRNTMLSVPNKDFRPAITNVLQVVAGQQEKEKRANPRPVQQQQPQQQQKRALQPEQQRPSGRYTRETAPDAALRGLGAQNLGLQDVGFAAAPMPGPSVVPTTVNQIPAPPPPAYLTAPTGQRPPQAKPRPPSSSSQQQRPSSGKQQPQQQKQSSSRGIPIILVAPGDKSMLNMYNAKAFLEEGKYKTAEQCIAEGVTRHSKMYVERTIGIKGDKPVRYFITDTEPPLSDARKAAGFWNNVVAVFCIGKAWQFKNCPIKGANKGDMVDTFNKVCGIYLHFSDEPVNPVVKGWNVKLLPISRQLRSRDMTVAADFYKHLDQYLSTHGCPLHYN